MEKEVVCCATTNQRFRSSTAFQLWRSSNQHQPMQSDRVQLTAQFGYSVAGRSTNCFAVDDELVVASSSDHRLLIWSVPKIRGDRIIDQSLLSLSGHQHRICNVRYCKSTSSAASCDVDGVSNCGHRQAPAESLMTWKINPISFNRFFYFLFSIVFSVMWFECLIDADFFFYV